MWRSSISIIGLLFLAASLSASCGDDGDAGSGSAGSPQATCAPAETASPLATCWVQLAPLGSGGFPPEPGSNDSPKWEPGRWPVTIEPVIAFNGDLWGTSQTNAWSSSDGLNWSHYAKTDTGSRIWQAHAFFKDRLWMIGGLDYTKRAPTNEIWSSGDGKTWAKDENAEWSPRSQAAVVVFRDRLWLFGGADKVQSDFTTLHMLNDIWTSDDGLRWTQATAAAPWSGREGARVLVFNDALYMIGGEGLADAWRSDDGVSWAQLTAQAEWEPRNGYGTAVYAGKLWAYAGWVGKSTNALNDIWYSSDGKSWTRQTEHAPWGPRSPRSIVYKDRLWIFSGKHTGAKDSWGGDIWAMTVQ